MHRRVLGFVVLICLATASVAAGFLNTTTVVASDKAHDLLKSPSDLAVVHATGDLIVSDSMHHRIVRVTPSGEVFVLAGSGKPGRADGAGPAAEFHEPRGVAVDETRRIIYVADRGNHEIRSITFEGVVGTLAGSGRPEDKDGSGTQAGFKEPCGITIDANGTLYVADTGNSRIKQVTPSGVVTTIAGDVHDGFADGASSAALFKQPEGLVWTSDGVLYIADTGNHVIRRMQNGRVTTIAGTRHAGSGDGAGAVAEFKEPSGIAAGDDGTLYVGDTGNGAIRRVTVGPAVQVSTLTGFGKAGFTDGSLSTAQFRGPQGIAFAGALWIADSGNDAIRRIDASVAITSVDPHSGAAAGGAVVHVLGGGFVPGATQVTFGSSPATSVVYVRSTELIVVAPAVIGTVDVTVTTPGGSATAHDAYSTMPPPTIAAVTPPKGTVRGGQLVTITGTNFIAPMTMRVGALPATSVTVINSNTLTAITPAASAGPFDVTVATSAGAATKIGAFTCFAAPVIANLTPTRGTAGTVVTITGSNFDPDPSGDAVLFGSIPAAVSTATTSQLVVTAPAGVTTGFITVTTAGGSTTSAITFSTATLASLEITAPVTSFGAGDAVPFNAIARLLDGSGTDVSAQAAWSTSNESTASVAGGLITGHGPGTATISATFGGFTATKSVTIQSVTVPIAAPSTIDRTVVHPLAENMRFLFSGPAAVQTGVATGAINDDRLSTVRGSVFTRGGAPLPGVEITIANHPELGHTFTRADGRFDLAFNGGVTVTVAYRKAGWLEAERLVTAQWNEQKVLDDVVLVPFDTRATVVTMNNSAAQIAHSSQITDSDGTRTTSMIVPAGESAVVTTPDGTITVPSSLHLRATEYTAGTSGPEAMPAPLSPYAGYTYCVELTADEANGGSVSFAKPVSIYLENFLGFPAGSQIPLAYYDHASNGWIAARNGRVIRIVSVVNGLAMIDADGDGTADSDAALATLGFDQAERTTLAASYSAGQTLWRMRVNHFSTWDGNVPVGPPSDAKGPKSPKPKTIKGKSQASCKVSGWSIVDCANQTLGESIPIQGTPYALEYDSARAGRADYSTRIELTGADVPASMTRVELKVTIAGQDHRFAFSPQPNLEYTFTWDGRDGFGRPVPGAATASIEITYVYPMVYQPGNTDPGWNIPAEAIQAAIRRAGDFRITAASELYLGHFGSGDAGFGSWTFSGQRQYDGIGRVIYDANGNVRAADPQQTHETALATLTLASPGDLDLFTMAPAPDGTLYFSDGYKIRKTTPDGVTTDVAGTTQSGFTPDGFSALGNPLDLWQITTGPDGTLYLIDGTRVRTIVNGRWTTIAGNDSYEPGPQPEGVPATSRSITAWSIASGPDGAIYIGSLGHIYKIDFDGTIRTVAGIRDTGGRQGSFADGASAFSVSLGTVRGVAVARDGSLYYANGEIVGRITTDGRLFHVMDTNPQHNFYPNAVTVAGDGTVLVPDVNDRRVWMIGPDGVPATFAGTGQFQNEAVLPRIGMSRNFMLGSPLEAKVASDGSVYILDWWFEAIRHVGAAFPPARAAATVIPSQDGGLAYVFENGRHMRTVDAVTNVTLETFQYDASGNLTGVRDVDGLDTTIERDTLGNPTGIVAPNGQRTTLAVTAGKLQSISEPGGATYHFEYGANDLLKTLTDRRGGLHTFTYDDDGLLIHDQDPAGGFISLTRSGIGNTFNVSRVSAEGRAQTYATVVDASGSEMHTHVGQDGLATTTTFYAGATSVVYPTGSTSSTSAPDPRFGMLAPITSATMTIGSKTVQATRSSAVVLSDPGNILSLASVTDTLVVNGRTSTSTYDAATRRAVMRSPAGRQVTMTLDSKGRPVLVQQAQLADGNLTYDARGNLAAISFGTRTTTFGYDAFDRLTSTTDPLNRTVSFIYDSANRVTSETLPGGRTIRFTYDADDNVTSIAPPSRPTHGFTFTPVNLPEQYAPPVVSNGGITQYTYNKDRQLTHITRPDAQIVAFDYDTAGRLSKLTTPAGFLTYGYDTAGRVASATNAQGASLAYSWDGSLLTSQSWTGQVSGTVAFTYDADLRLASEDGVTLAYDDDGLLTTAGALTLQRDAQTGLITSTALGNLSDTRVYNSFGEVMAYAASIGGSEVLRESYTRDGAGRITQIVETTGVHSMTTAYTYDDAGRLATVTRDGQPLASYSYDGNGNRQNGTYDDQDRLLMYGGTTYTYTSNGELATKTDASGVTTYTHDAFGNLRTVVLPDGRNIDYVFDAQNRRVGKKVDGALIAGWLYADRLRIVAEIDGTSVVTKRFVYGSRTNVPDYMVFNGVMYRIICDHLGSPRYVLEVSSGTVVEAITYDEFGNVLTDTNPGFQPFGFAGGLIDRDTGLEKFGARDYDPNTGRWTAKDPIGFYGGDTDLYAYASNDPVNLLDPDGLTVYPADYVGPLKPGDSYGRSYTADLNDPRLSPLMHWGIQAPQYYGTTQQCVSLTRAFSGAPCHACWRAGIQVMGGNILPGTAIATMPNGRYPGDNDTHKNSGIYIAQGMTADGQSGLVMIDQWPGHMAMMRFVRAGGGQFTGDISNDANAYYVIMRPNGGDCGCGKGQ